MKLKKILKYIDWGTDVKIWAANNSTEEFKMVHEGWKDEIPKKYLNYRLIKAENNEDSEAICPYHRVTPLGTDRDGIRITIVKEKE